MRKFTLTTVGSLNELAKLSPNVISLGEVAGDHPDDEDELAMLGIDTDAPGAWPKGTRVVKAWNAEGDTHALGASATVRGSVGAKEYPLAIPLDPGEVIYCVEWDDTPGKPVFCRGKKLARAE
jgi:hypothetical protein